MKPVREPAVAGRFYPRDAGELSAMVRALLEAARREGPPAGRLVALAAPHAGYIFSGAVAAAAFAVLTRGAFQRVVVIAPSHRIPFAGSSIYDRGGYRTPLGVIPIDEDLARGLLSNGAGEIAAEPEHHRAEHSLEVHLPFLQEALGEFLLTPIVMGNPSAAHVRCLGDAIAKTVKALGAEAETILVASTDLSHYHADDVARRMDRIVIADLEAFDADALRAHLDAGECEACGAGPLLATLRAARALGASRASCIRYATSADTSGDREDVVGYAAVSMTAAEDRTPLSAAAREALLVIARASVRAAARGAPHTADAPALPELARPRGAFVTLSLRGRLRGCIGRVVTAEPLWKSVSDAAREAALDDPRFAPLSPREADDVSIEISVLRPLRRIRGAAEIEAGDGLLIRKSGCSGLLLPQVAAERGWGAERFLEETCAKAGLARDAWRRGAEIRAFTAEVFR